MSLPAALGRLETAVEEVLASRDRGTDLEPLRARYAGRPVEFSDEVLGIKLYSKQREIAESVRDNRRTLVLGANGTGKDAVAAAITLYAVYVEQALVLITAATERQAISATMDHVGRLWRAAGNLPGELFRSSLRVPSVEQCGVLAFTSNAAGKLTGLHAPKMYGILSEAQEIEGGVGWEGIMSCTTGEDDRLLAYGNPTSPSGMFYNAAESGRWELIRIPAAEHPNITGEGPFIPGGPSAAWIEDIASTWGKGSPQYQGRVLAQFPTEDEYGLVKRAWFTAAAERWEDQELHEDRRPAGLPIIAVDPARFGPDQTVLAVMRGPRVAKILSWRGASTMETVGKIELQLREAGIRPAPAPMRSASGGIDAYGRPTLFAPPQAPPDETGRLVVDEIGVGGGVVDRLRERGYRVTAFNGGGQPRGKDRKRFLNQRAQGYWTLRRALERGEISLPPDAELREELVSTRWHPTSSGQVQIEAKVELRARLGRSPDSADAVSMCVLEWARLRAKAEAPAPPPSFSFTATRM